MLVGHIKPQRAKSPIFYWPRDKKCAEMRRNGVVGGQMQINRIELRRSAKVEVLYADSPSCVWVRLPNHIAESQLRIIEPYDLERFVDTAPGQLDTVTQDIIDQYFLCPHEDEALARGFARCRVLQAHRVEDGGVMDILVKVIFIDSGETRWVSVNVLATLPKEMLYHPWQAICVSVANLRKIGFSHTRGSLKAYWTEEECEKFREIVGQYKYFMVKVMFGSVVRNDYREPIKVEMRGVREVLRQRPRYSRVKGAESGIDVAEQFCSAFAGSIETFEVLDASHVPSVLYIPNKTVPGRSTIADTLLKWPTGWRKVDIVENPLLAPSEEWEKWTPALCEVPVASKQWLRENGYYDKLTGSYWLNVEGTNTQSPFEWYARPIKVVKKKFTDKEKEEIMNIMHVDKETIEEQEKMADPTASMLQADEELKKHAEILDTFYSVGGNRIPLEREEVKKYMEEGKKIYAITCAPEERATFTGEWQRVEVYKFDDFAHIRFLDSGGRDQVPSVSLFKLHPRHAKHPPLCVQLCLQGVRDPHTRNDAAKTWEPERKTFFNSLLRVDVPILVSLFEQPFLNAPRRFDAKIFEEDHVMFVKNVKILGEPGSIDQSFLGFNHKKYARADPNWPLPDEVVWGR